jgi:hypothetical protein
MKATFRIPTKEYAYIELNEVEVTNTQEAREKYLELERVVNGEVGLPTKEWNDAMDKYLSTNSLSESEYMSMSAEQKHIIQEVKKSCKRLNKDA